MEKDTLLSPRSMFKILILGDHSTGKTSILYKYMNLMSHVNITTGYEQHIHYTKISNKDFSFNILDLSGHHSYNKFVERLIDSLNYDGIIFVFDLTSINSFKNLSYWMEISNVKNKLFNILIGNKFDKPNRIVSSNVINDFVQKNNLYYFETSTISNENITNAFNFFFKNIVHLKLYDTNILIDKVDNNNQQSKRNCCFNAF